MKKDIHPNYHEALFDCACGSKFKSATTKKGDVVKVDVCSACHPFYAGTQKQVETGGRVSRFNQRRTAGK
ncbi:MAG: 50S ribosomal protein L31 [Defluviitaleaceae bacterium]|nr:50S ribosomal protein L31 [Defluviitaleaceae bacterium]